MRKFKFKRQLALIIAIAVILSLFAAVALILAMGGCAITGSIPVPAMTNETSPEEMPTTKESTPASPPSSSGNAITSNTMPPAPETTAVPSSLPSLDISLKSGKTTVPPTTTKPKTSATKQTSNKTTSSAGTTEKTTTTAASLSAPGAVAITFDDGPGKHTGKLLDALKKYDVRVTFFVQGQFVESRPDLILRMHQEGHQIANHSYSHNYLSLVSADVRRSQLKSTSDAIERITGSRPTLMRPPGGYRSEPVYQEAGKQGMATVFWDLDPGDWKKNNKNVNYIYNYLLDHTKKGKIILLHDIHQTTVDGFIKALPVLIGRGFAFVTVDGLVKLQPGDGYPSYLRR